MSKVSIIIPLFNRESLITATLNSVMCQIHKDWEVVIVDDGSTDNSFSVVKLLSQKDKRIKLLKRNRLPKGAPTCRNIGLEYSTGDYIMFLDSDDLLSDSCLQKRLKKMNSLPNSDFLIFQSILFNKQINDLKIVPNILNKPSIDLDRFLNVDYPWNVSAPFIKRSFLIMNNITFTEDLVCHQDIEFSVNLIINSTEYYKFDDIQDVFIRMGEKDKISSKVNEPSYLAGKIRFIELVISFLNSKNLLTDHNKKIIFNLSVYYSMFFIHNYFYIGVFHLLKILRQYSIITSTFISFLRIFSYYLQRPKRKYNIVEKISNKLFELLHYKSQIKDVPPLDSTLGKIFSDDLL